MVIFGGIKCVLNFWTIMVGRLGTGIFSGFTGPIFSKIITDTIPNEKIQFLGLFQNGGIGAGIFFLNLLETLILPDSFEPKEVLA